MAGGVSLTMSLWTPASLFHLWGHSWLHRSPLRTLGQSPPLKISWLAALSTSAMCYGVNCVIPKIMLKFYLSGPQNVTLFGNRVAANESCLVQFSSVVQSCPTLCDPMNRSTPGLPVHHQLPEFTQTHVHWVGDAIQPSHPLSSPSPPAPNPSQHQSFPISQLFAWGGQSCSVISNSLRLHEPYSPWNSPGQNTGVGSFSLLQEIYPTQRSNPGFLYCTQILCQLSYQGSPMDQMGS